jgi:hypothetical protein
MELPKQLPESTASAKKPGPYFDEEQNELTRTEWIADRLLATYLAMDKPNPGPATLAVMAEDLASELSDEQLLRGLSRLRKEREWVSVKAIIELSGSTIADGRPEVETAWAMCPRSEEKSVVWTSEMAEAFDCCRTMLNSGEEIAARMIFKEQYAQIVSRARVDHVSVKWIVSLGWDVGDRVRALSEAVQKKRIEAKHAFGLLGPEQQDELLLQLPAPERKLLVGEVKPNGAMLSGLQQTLATLAENNLMPKPEPTVKRKELTAVEWVERKRAAQEQAAAILKARGL